VWWEKRNGEASVETLKGTRKLTQLSVVSPLFGEIWMVCGAGGADHFAGRKFLVHSI
jgi:hypothetical protein